MTYAALSSFDLQTGIRLGKDFEIEKVMSGLEHPIIERTLPRLTLIHYLNSGRKAKLERALAGLTPQQLVDPMMLPVVIPVLRELGRTDELAAAEKAARDALPRQVAAGWRSMQAYRIFNAYALARALDEPGMIPPGFQAAVLRTIRNERLNLMFQIVHAQLRKNWVAMEKAAARAIEQFPTFYHFYYLHGEALWHLDRRDEARKRLEVYVKYGYDEMDYRQAQAWLKNDEA